MAQTSAKKVAIPSYSQRIQWFHEARFGIFVHWGLYSLLGRGEWTMLQERIPVADYAKLADKFNPKKFDANRWAQLAVDAGAKYMVLTTRHHDGFCLYDSQVSDFTSVKTAARRDLVAEYVDACRAAGLKVGLYYSLLDWRFPGYSDPKKYPDSAAALVQRVHDQVRELMTNYGKIDVLWYDGCWVGHGQVVDPDADDAKSKQSFEARFWKARKLNAMVRQLQPHILINNRSGTNEDLDTPEQKVVASKKGRGWESCMTMGDFCGWGYTRNNPNFKPTAQLIQHLVQAAGGEGNFLLNIGPKPDGTIRKREVVRLKKIGAFLKTNGEAIYGSQRCPLGGSTGPGGQDWNMLGLWTAKDNTAYLHVFRWPGREAVIARIKTKVRSVHLLGRPGKLKFRQEHNGRLIITGLPKKPPHPSASVLRIRFDAKPQTIREANKAAWLDGTAK